MRSYWRKLASKIVGDRVGQAPFEREASIVFQKYPVDEVGGD